MILASRHAPVHRVRNFGVADENFTVLVKDGVVRQCSRQDAKKETQAKHLDFECYENRRLVLYMKIRYEKKRKKNSGVRRVRTAAPVSQVFSVSGVVIDDTTGYVD